MNKFVYIERYGQLIIDRIIFETGYPILFICKNEKEQLFICVCCQNNLSGKKWLLSQTNVQQIIRLLKDQVTIRSVFLDNVDSRVSINSCDGNIEINYNDSNDWGEDSIFLPKSGEYLYADPGEFDEDIMYYEQMLEFSYKESKQVIREEAEVRGEAKGRVEERAKAAKEKVKVLIDTLLDFGQSNEEILITCRRSLRS